MKSKISIKRHGVPYKKKDKHLCSKLFGFTILTIFLGIISVGVQYFIKSSIQSFAIANLENLNESLNTTWIGSLASYWGGIIGGFISGTLTLVGVALTLRYYYDSDYKKNRIEFMPFLNLQPFKDLYTGKDVFSIKSEQHNNSSKEEIIEIPIKITNIGRGFAKTLVIMTGENFGGKKYDKLILENNEVIFKIEAKVDKEENINTINFAITYIDCMTNEYIQEYTIRTCRESNDIEIDSGYPQFFVQTHDIGR